LSEDESDPQKVDASKGTSYENYDIQSLNEKAFGIQIKKKDNE
jgi:hypothetical protein